MTKDEIAAYLAAHSEWITDPTKGSRANLSWAGLREADLSGADLSRADLSGADLRCANLSGADLRGADLSGADLRCANLSGANLRGADLRCANLRCANLGGADLSGADLSRADLVIALGQPNGWWAYAYLWEASIWLRVGCRTMSLTEGRTYWAGKDDRREVLAALDYAEIIAKLRGWEVEDERAASRQRQRELERVYSERDI